MWVLGLAWKGPQTTVRRRGIRWQLDLREGIDFWIRRFASFEPPTARTSVNFLRPGDFRFEVRANTGEQTLPLRPLAVA